MTVKVSPSHALRLAPDAAGIADAAARLRAGQLVAFATETVYGLGGDATSPAAVARIYEAKGRPIFNPLIAHVTGLEAALREGVLNSDALALAAAFWPGPLTLVVPVRASGSVCELARAGLVTIALRVPDHASAQALLKAAGRPIAGPSANRSGHVSPVDADHVLADLSTRIDAVLDSGRTRGGIESTIVACLDGPPMLLRPGGITRRELLRVVPNLRDKESGGAVVAPGMLASHYAPRAALRLDAQSAEPRETLLDFGGHFARHGYAVAADLSSSGNIAEAAANLYAMLRAVDAQGASRIAIAPLPRSGLGEAIHDRLIRAAAPRG